MYCTGCNIKNISPHEVEHCDKCAEEMRDKMLGRKVKIIFTVRIIKSTHGNLYWYHDKINELFECELFNNRSQWWDADTIYKTITPVVTTSYKNSIPQRGNILPQDCKVIDTRKEPVEK